MTADLPLSHADVEKIIRLVETLHGSKLQFLRIEVDGLEITVAKGDASSPSAGVPIGSPHVGVFRSRDLQVGAIVAASSVLGTIHTLDETNAVRAGVAGKLTEHCVRDGDFVEFGQPLYRILPANE